MGRGGLCGACGSSTWKSSWVTVAASLFVPYAILVLAYRTPTALNALVRPGDVSYGVYVYAFPVQQTVALAWKGATAVGMLVDRGARSPTLLGLASWRLIESRALALKGRVVGTSRPAGRALRGRGAGLALPALMLATTDRPLRLAFVGPVDLLRGLRARLRHVAALRHRASTSSAAAPTSPRCSRRSRRSTPTWSSSSGPRSSPPAPSPACAATTRRLPHRAAPAHRQRRGRQPRGPRAPPVGARARSTGRTSTASSPSTRSSRRPPTACCRSGARSRCRSPTATTAR